MIFSLRLALAKEKTGLQIPNLIIECVWQSPRNHGKKKHLNVNFWAGSLTVNQEMPVKNPRWFLLVQTNLAFYSQDV